MLGRRTAAVVGLLLLGSCRSEPQPISAARRTDALWKAVAAMPVTRGSHCATLLPDGRVLVTGGVGGPAATHLSSALLYDPATNTWASAGAMAAGRANHSAELLLSGKVLVAGGVGPGSLASAELYDPATNAWTSAGTMSVAHAFAASTRLADGRVLMIGGSGTLVDLYDPPTNTWSSAAPMTNGRGSFTATLLPSGKVLVTGGEGAMGPLSSAELYDPATNTWTSAATMGVARGSHTATLLATGSVLIVGGAAAQPSSSAELYVPSTNSWSSTAPMTSARTSHTATLLPSGRVLVAGGAAVASSELYVPSSGWLNSEPMASARSSHSATLLPSGKVLLVGGLANNSVELYEAGLPLGATCLADTECLGGFCVDGACCNGACSGPCDACNLPSALGTCTVRSAGSAGSPSCSPVVCNGAAPSCPSFCMTSAHCAPTHFCGASVCYPRMSQGSACSEASACLSGNCVDGFCCDSACGEPCDGCDLPGTVGTCTTRPTGSNGVPSCLPYVCSAASAVCPVACTSNAVCGPNHYCNQGACGEKRKNGGACAAEAECASGICAQNLCCDKACTGACDACNLAGTEGSCTRKAATLACPALCNGDADCAGTHYCSEGTCVIRPAPGSACTEPKQCPGGHCFDGVCCDRACAGACDSCNLTGTLGTCTLLALGTEGTPSCAPYLCTGASPKCRGTCVNDAHCAPPNFCSGGFCTTKAKPTPPPAANVCGCQTNGSAAVALFALMLGMRIFRRR